MLDIAREYLSRDVNEQGITMVPVFYAISKQERLLYFSFFHFARLLFKSGFFQGNSVSNISLRLKPENLKKRLTACETILLTATMFERHLSI